VKRSLTIAQMARFSATSLARGSVTRQD
jgi:hypothetical protein